MAELVDELKFLSTASEAQLQKLTPEEAQGAAAVEYVGPRALPEPEPNPSPDPNPSPNPNPNPNPNQVRRQGDQGLRRLPRPRTSRPAQAGQHEALSLSLSTSLSSSRPPLRPTPNPRARASTEPYALRLSPTPYA